MPITNKFARVLQLLVSFFLITAASYFFIFALNAIYHYGIRPLFADQWRIYTDYFSKPFPQNVLALQNGHRPVIAGLFFLLDLNMFQGKQNFLLIVGTILAITTAIGILWPMLKSRHLTFLYKSVAIYIVLSGMFWLGNHRILLHANESVHAYLVTVFLLAALWAITKCKKTSLQSSTSLWCIIACILSQLAVFSFGAGVAVPPTLLIIALLLRFPKFLMSILCSNVIFTAIIYLLLPNATGVTNVLVSSGHNLQQLINIFYLAGAPVAFLFSSQFSFQQTTPWIINYLCPFLGGMGLAIVAIKVVWLLYKKKAYAGIKEINTFGLAIFFGLTIVLIAIMRANFFIKAPQQIFANRYLIWSNFFWISMGLMLINEVSTFKNILRKRISCVGLILGCILTAFLINHNNTAKMPSIENWRNTIQLASTSLVASIHDNKLIKRGLREPPAEVYSLSQKLQSHKLNMFAYPIAQSMGKNINSYYYTSFSSVPGRLIIKRIFNDQPNHSLSARISGQINAPDLKIKGILITTKTGTVTGIAAIPVSRYKPAQQQTFFSGYIRDYDSKMKYRLYGIMGQNREVIRIIF